MKIKNKSYFFCSFAKVFSRENKLFPRFAKVFSTKFVSKTAKRESLFHKFRVFFDTQKFLPAKVSALKVVYDTRSNNSQYNNAQFMQKLYMFLWMASFMHKLYIFFCMT